MTHEIWIAQLDDSKLAFVGDKRSLEAGRIEEKSAEVLARLIAANEGKDLKVVDGHQASNLMHTHKFTELQSQSTPRPKHSLIKPIQKRKQSF